MDSLPTLTQTVRQYGLAANKRLGQHFLLDMNITDKIARLASPFEGISIAEIGPGPGGLTRSLLKAGAEHILAIEMDDRFLEPLADISAIAGDKLRVINTDALKVDIASELSGDIRIVANLPYNVGTKLLINWLTAKPLFWSRAVLMFQKEVADRVAAEPGGSAYGRLAILSQSVCDVEYAFDVPAKAFTPPPKVDSAVIVLNSKSESDRFENLTLLGEVTGAAFGQRRKMLRRSLKTIAAKYKIETDAWLTSCDIEPTRRPETLAVSEFHRLAHALPAFS